MIFDIWMPRADCYDVWEKAASLESEDLAGAEDKGASRTGTHTAVRLPRAEFQLHHTSFVNRGRLLKLSSSQFPCYKLGVLQYQPHKDDIIQIRY